jgi:Flp pilus assembly protein TadG
LAAPVYGEREQQRQKGQAIVLIAIALAVVVGMAALAIDGSRAYALRRDLQEAVDAAALAAADSLQQTGNYITAEQAASTIFGTNLRLYASPSCSPGYASPGASSVTVSCTYSDGTVLTQVVSALGPQGSRFAITATQSLPLQFGRILTNGTTPQLTATGSSGVNNLLQTPTLAALSGAGCGGTAGTAITIDAGGTLSVIGDVVSNGRMEASNATRVAGDVYARCQSPVPNVTNTCYPSGAATPCTYPDVAGARAWVSVCQTRATRSPRWPAAARRHLLTTPSSRQVRTRQTPTSQAASAISWRPGCTGGRPATRATAVL